PARHSTGLPEVLAECSAAPAARWRADCQNAYRLVRTGAVRAASRRSCRCPPTTREPEENRRTPAPALRRYTRTHKRGALMKRIGTLLFCGLLTGGPLAAQPRDAAVAPGRPPQIWIDPALGMQPIELQDVAIDVRVEGFVASTTIDLTFYNPNPRVLEGELVFPLAAGQSITGYALEVGGKLRQGVVVEKETARVAFQATTRRGIDPG